MSLLSSSSCNYLADCLFATASTLVSLLWAAIDRVQEKASDRKSETETRTFLLHHPTSDLSINQVRKVEQKSRKHFRKFVTSKYDIENKEIPQKLLKDSVPIVFHTLPDPERWKIIEAREKEQEKQFKNSSIFLTTLKNYTKNTKNQRKPNLSQLRVKRSRRKRRSIYQNPQLEGILRRRQLYCRTGYHLQILPNGRISGTEKDHNKYAILDFISVGVGLVTIRGVESGKYLSMDSRGRLYGSNVRTRESTFKETLQENWYNSYSAFRSRNKRTRQCYIAFNRNGRWRQGCRLNSNQRITQFLPRPVDPEKVPELYKGILY